MVVKTLWLLHRYTNCPGTLTQGRLSELVMMKPAWVMTILMKYAKMSQARYSQIQRFQSLGFPQGLQFVLILQLHLSTGISTGLGMEPKIFKCLRLQIIQNPYLISFLFPQVSYFCEPPKLVTGYNGSAIYDIWCSAANFPRWQFTVGYNDLPRCMFN